MSSLNQENCVSCKHHCGDCHLAFADDKVKDECGVFGIYAPSVDVAQICYFALYALQHRGQESTGIATFDGDDFYVEKDSGLVSEIFDLENLHRLKGDIALAHCRYGGRNKKISNDNIINALPMSFNYYHGEIALSYNGALVNKDALWQQLTENGAVFQTESDCEIIASLLAKHSKESLVDSFAKTMGELKGAYAFVAMMKDKLIGVRDPHGIRPLVIGKLGEHYLLSSESCAFDAVGAETIRDVNPGEIVVIDKDGLHTYQIFEEQPNFCIFEHVYIARPDSVFDGQSVSEVRRRMGQILAEEAKIDADIVIPVPDSGTACALGYAEGSGLPFRMGLLKNRYIGRTFIQPTQEMRERSVHIKLNPIRATLEGQRVIMVDDSVVRGTTSKQIVEMVRNAGAKEVHLVLSCPPVKFGCPYGIDTASGQLIAVTHTVEQISEYIGADSVHFLSQEGMLKATGLKPEDFCVACFDGSYIVDPSGK